MSPPVRQPDPARALTAAQRRALLAMCPESETAIPELAEALGMRPNGTALALQGLERRGFVVGEDGIWSMTFTGRALARRLGATR